MATNLEEIALHLDNHKIRFRKYVEKSTLVFEMSNKNYKVRHILYVGDEGNTLVHKVYLLDEEGKFLKVPYNHEYIKKFMKFLLYSSSKIKLGSWEYDFNNGVFCFASVLPLNDSVLSEKQFKLLFSAQMFASKKEFVYIKTILETGKFPKITKQN